MRCARERAHGQGASMTRAPARLLAFLLLTAGTAGAQTFSAGGHASIGDALRTLDRLRTLRSNRPLSSKDLQQTFVLPERPGQNLVSWYAFDWLHYDVASPSGGTGGI